MLGSRVALAALLVLGFSAQSGAREGCRATGVIGGRRFSLKHCAAAYYASSRGVTLWFLNRAPHTAHRAPDSQPGTGTENRDSTPQASDPL